MPELLAAITAAQLDGFTVSLYFSGWKLAERKCDVSVMTPCYAHRDYICRHLCSLRPCTIEEAAALITRLTDFPC
jgi:hypothetical protein